MRGFYVRLHMEKKSSLKEINAASLIQFHVRSFLHRNIMIRSALLIQRYVRVILSKNTAINRKTSVIAIQSWFRGNIIRKYMSKNLLAVARRVRKANADAIKHPELKLGVRTMSALHTVLKGKSLSEIFKAVHILEISTRLSRSCCQAFADANAPSILYDFMPTCNRSLPHVELLQVILKTIVNVSIYDECFHSVASTSAVDVLLTLLMHFRDKDGVFNLAIYLLNILVTNSNKMKVGSDFL